MNTDPTVTITAPGFEVLAVCLRCYGQLRSWRPEAIDAFRAWHRDKCGVEKPQVNGVQWGSEGGPARRESPGPWPQPARRSGRD